jgi:hypothetical protein
MHFFFSIFHQNTTIEGIVSGNFGKFNGEKIALLRGSYIDLLISKKKNGKIFHLSSLNLFRLPIFINIFQIKNEKKNFIILMDNEGKISLLLIKNKNKFFICSQKNMAKFFSKENLPPFKAALNKKSLILMISAVEKLKFFFLIGKNKENLPFFLKSRIEIKNFSIICFYLISFESKKKEIFVCIETYYTRPYDKLLVSYETDFQTNTVIRKIIAKINNSSYLLIPIGNWTKTKCLLIFSEGLITLIDPFKKKYQIKTIPFKKKKNETLQTFISSFTIYTGKKFIFLLFSNQDGDLFKMVFDLNLNFMNLSNNIHFYYFDSLNSEIKFLTILQNGFLFSSFESGNHKYFQFISLGKKKNPCKIFFLPRKKYQNLRLIDELTSFSPLIAIDKIDFLNENVSYLILLCGTSVRSLVRILQASCCLRLLGFKKFNFCPISLNIIGSEFFLQFILLSFLNFTIIFRMKQNFEEINNDGFLSDDLTISVEKFHSKKIIVQTGSKKIRIIFFYKKKKKLIEWKPLEKVLIVNSNIYAKKIFHIFIILSNGKGILIGFSEKSIITEYEHIELKYNIFLNSFFGVSYPNHVNEKWDFFLLFSKYDKSIRIYSFDSENFMKLLGICVLPWSPETARIYKKNKKFFLLISLNNGFIIEAEINIKKQKIENKILKYLSISPIFISPLIGKNAFLIFGSKIWLYETFNLKKNFIHCISNEPADLVEAFNDFLFIIKGKIFRILKKKQQNIKFVKNFKIPIALTPVELYLSFSNHFSNFFVLIFRENFSNFYDHQFNLKNYKKNKFDLALNHKTSPFNWISGLCLLSFEKLNFLLGSKNKILDLLVIRGSNSKKVIANSITKNFLELKKNIILVCFEISKQSINHAKPMILTNEQLNSSLSIGAFHISENWNFFPQKGGRVKKLQMFIYLFENFLPIFSHAFSFCLMSKILFGQRFICGFDKTIMIFEIEPNVIKNILNFTGSSQIISKINVLGNFLYIFDEIQGFKIFKFNSYLHSIKLIVEKNDINCIEDCIVLDPITFLIINRLGNIYFFRIRKNLIESHQKLTGVCDKLNIISLAELETDCPWKKLLVFSSSNSFLKKSTIIIANQCGTLGTLLIIPEKNVIPTLYKIYNFINLYEKKKNFVFDRKILSFSSV